MCVFSVGLYCVKESEYCVEKVLTLSIIIIIRGYENRVIYVGEPRLCLHEHRNACEIKR